MAHIQNVLVGVDLHHGDRLASQDLSDESKAAVNEAFEIAATFGSTIVFFSVLEISAQSQSLIEHDHENVFRTVEDIANEVLKGLVESAASQGIRAESILRFGTAWDEIAKEATGARGYDLVIVGSRSRSRARQFLFGTTAQKLMRVVSCPVWIARPAESQAIRDVAVATDLSPTSAATLHFAVAVARALGARLHLLHVLENSDFRYLILAGVADQVLQQTESRLRQQAEDRVRAQLQETDFRTLPRGAKIELLEGSPDVAIAEYVDREKFHLLVIGSHGHHGFADAFLGNTAERILHAVAASLIVVKPADFQKTGSR